MRIVRRNLIAVVITLAVIFVGVYWIAPVALSFYAARKAPAVARIVPAELKDTSVSQAPGTKLSYFGYEFEVPWNDLDETQTTLYPKDKPEKTRVDLHFRSGLRLWVTAIPPRSWVKELATDFKVAPEKIESSFGRSDYAFVKTLYEFTPDKMHHWAFMGRGEMRDEFLLMTKSIALSRAAETGIFDVQNQSYKGFQQGNPQVRPYGIEVHLFSDDGSVEMIFFQKDYKNPAGVTQPEINRIVQTLHKAPQNESTTTRVAQK